MSPMSVTRPALAAFALGKRGYPSQSEVAAESSHPQADTGHRTPSRSIKADEATLIVFFDTLRRSHAGSYFIAFKQTVSVQMGQRCLMQPG